MRTLLGLSMLALLASCQSAAKAKDYRWVVKAPPTIEAESKLRFTVETVTDGGEQAREVPYIWKVDWVGIEGSHHQGYSFKEQSIRVKGAPGKARLRIFAEDPAGERIEVANTTITVVGHPPAE
jgi:hypothetical protein